MDGGCSNGDLMKIAVVGAGISGLVCAHHLSARSEVHVFEAGAHIGGHTNTLDVQRPSGHFAIDTGFIVFNDWTYPRFIRLLDKLNVPSQASTMSFSVKAEKSGLEYNGADLNRMFAQRKNIFRPSFYRMILDILRFNKESLELLESSGGGNVSLGTYLTQKKYSREFIEHYIVPMGAAIWSSNARQMHEFPAVYFVRFFKNHGMLSVDKRPSWRVIKNGSRSYLPELTRPFKDRLYSRRTVKKITRNADGVTLNIDHDGTIEESHFDQVVMAGHADQTLSILSDASSLEREILGSFAYQENKTLLHTDISVLPKNKKAWAAWNYWVPQEPLDKVAVTYNMNILQTIDSEETFLVSLNMENQIDPSKILKKILYHHPVYTAHAVASQKRWHEISGKNRTHFCGAYWGYGFHEDGVVSGERVCEDPGVQVS